MSLGTWRSLCSLVTVPVPVRFLGSHGFQILISILDSGVGVVVCCLLFVG